MRMLNNVIYHIKRYMSISIEYIDNLPINF